MKNKIINIESDFFKIHSFFILVKKFNYFKIVKNVKNIMIIRKYSNENMISEDECLKK